MAMDDTESCCSRPVDDFSTQTWRQKQKVGVYVEVLRRLRLSHEAETSFPGFEDELWAHFHRLPTRYAMDVNVERAQDVLMHKDLLFMAHAPATRPAIDVRLVQVHSSPGTNSGKYVHSNLKEKVDQRFPDYDSNQRQHPPPAFGSTTEVESGFAISQLHDINQPDTLSWPMHEITISTIDKPKLLSQLTSLLSEIGLNIQEAHAFSTTDGFSLDVFVVDGWAIEDTKQLKDILAEEISKIQKRHPLFTPWSISPTGKKDKIGVKFITNYVNIPRHKVGAWEIDASLLIYEKKIVSGSFSDLYKGTFYGQEVAIKLLKDGSLNEAVRREFAQEIHIMRNLRHKNVVQFIGASTRPPSAFIVTEYMPGGSMHDFLHQKKGVLSFPSLLRVAVDVSKGMNYLHQKNIIHRDLKAANLLLDEDGVVKVADFGVARVQSQSGVMTAETGTYRWMAPEVIEHKPYDHKADVYSFGIVLWELLTGQLPYDNLTPLQAAMGVIQKGLRPKIPRHANPMIVDLLERCWRQDPSLRPEFSEITKLLQQTLKEGTFSGTLRSWNRLHNRKLRSGRAQLEGGQNFGQEQSVLWWSEEVTTPNYMQLSILNAVNSHLHCCKI
ncbi:serine/threonine-protein kinase STY8-like isoform X3 [Cucurbita pepo subsp. pepo]|uniref:serine/threonine-protein kinase STY8-like isoform X3 n=1 Tax=Cucurbita pepo subsp. pepo TaxID=3664 RepID=UPI000C9D8A0A|nr:serine/threonine-protein kinase STY8-like isoform X3 [Cucurbita pepo subsp. pepo]